MKIFLINQYLFIFFICSFIFSYHPSYSQSIDNKNFHKPCTESEMTASLFNTKIFDNREKLCLVEALKVHFIEGWVGELSRLTPDEMKWFESEKSSKLFADKFYGGDLENNKLFIKGMLIQNIDNIVFYLNLLKKNYLKLGESKYEKKINIHIIRLWGSILEIISLGNINDYRKKLIFLKVLKYKDASEIDIKNPLLLRRVFLPHILATIFVFHQM